jgi:hypothetical protein
MNRPDPRRISYTRPIIRITEQITQQRRRDHAARLTEHSRQHVESCGRYLVERDGVHALLFSFRSHGGGE